MEKKAVDFLQQISVGHNMNHIQIMNKYKNQPICPRCQRPAYRDKGWTVNKAAGCPKCGWRGSTITLDMFMTQKYYR